MGLPCPNVRNEMPDEPLHEDGEREFHDPFAQHVVVFLAAAIPLLIVVAYLTRIGTPLTAILSAFASGLVAVAYWQRARPTNLHAPSPWVLLLTTPAVRYLLVAAGGSAVLYGVFIGLSHPTLLIAAIALLATVTGIVAVLLWRSYR